MSSKQRSVVRLEARSDVNGGARLREQMSKIGKEEERLRCPIGRIGEEEERLERGTDMGHG